MINIDLRTKFLTYLQQQKRYTEDKAAEILQFAEEQLPPYINKFFDTVFFDIYTNTKYEYYSAFRGVVLSEENQDAYNDNISCGEAYTQTLKLYIDFLQSKSFKGKEKVNLTYFEKAEKRKKLRKDIKLKSSTENIDPLLPPAETQDELTEGKLRQVNITIHERNRSLRQECLAHYGYKCQVCGMSFEQNYGEIGKNFIEVHHLKPIADTDEQHALDPITGLVPLCSNCHAMIHRGGEDNQPMSLEDLKQLYKQCKNQ